MAYYFAWVADGNTTFGPAHYVEDEQVFGFTIEHQEGDFPALTIEIVNPRAGLLNTDREQWAWFSWRKPDNSVVPLFHGRLIGIPESINETVVSLEFSARPTDYDAQKTALVELLKVAPYYDPIWIDQDKRSDPDTVLEARPQLWHIGRTDKLVTVSNILVGEDGTITLDDSDVLNGNLSLSYGDPPIQKVHVVATVNWDQTAKGTVDLTQSIIDKFGGGQNISSFTGQGLEASWPVFGDDIGGGWSVFSSRVKLLSGTAINASYHRTQIDPKKATPDFPIESWWASSPEGYTYWYNKAYEEWLAQQMLNPIREARFYLWVFRPTFIVQYDASRSRKEVLTFDVSADSQALINEAAPTPTEITIESSSVVEPIDADKGIPIGDPKRRTYFGQPRGKRSIDYLLALVRARILMSARAVEIEVQTKFVTGVAFSCRKDIVLTLNDLPGGEARGKIIGYTLELDGDRGEASAKVKIGCCIGRGNLLSLEDGDPTYTDENYVVDYQYRAGADLDPFGGDLAYEDFIVIPNDDGIDFYHMTPANVIDDLKASALLTFTGPGTAGNTIIAVAKTYTLRATLTVANEVKIGTDAGETARNLADAINATEGQAGVTYGVGTIANADVSATVAEGIVRATARIAGSAGNALSVSETSPAASWDHPTLTGGAHGVNVYSLPSAQAAILNATFGSVQEAIDALNAHFTEIEVSLKPVDNGPFETDLTIAVTDLMVPKTIDLEAV